MDKKIGIIVGILVVAIIGLIIFAFMADSKDPYIVTLNDVGYDKQDFETYYKIRYVEEKKKLEDGSSEDLPEVSVDDEIIEPDNSEENTDDSSKEVDKEELKDTSWTEYLNAIFLNQIASQKGYTASDDLEENILENYNSESIDKEALAELGVTQEDYVRVEKIIEMSNDFYDNLDKYYPISDETVDQYIADNSDEMRGIDFRIMQFNITSTEATTDENGEEVPATSNKEEIEAKARDVLERVKNGEDFETLAKENADSRYVLTGSELKQVNGDIESIDLPYLSNELMFSCSDLADPIKALKEVGEYTELLVTDNYAAFAKLEEMRDTITDETKAELKTELAKYYAQVQISYSTPTIITNSRLLKSISL